MDDYQVYVASVVVTCIKYNFYFLSNFLNRTLKLYVVTQYKVVIIHNYMYTLDRFNES